jgi:uncharacterized protein (TIGR03083 family)
VARLLDARSPYASAAAAFLDLVAPIPLSRYAGPGLGDWDLRSLVGHTGRSFVTVASYLGSRADSVVADSAAAYFAVVAGVAQGDGAGIVQRGIDAGRSLGENPVGALHSSYAAAVAALDALGDEDPVVPTAAGGMRVSDYLPTRTFELTVHSLDIARALDGDFEPPPDALSATLFLATETALAQGFGVDVVLALTGRQPLAPERSVVP